VYGQLKQGGEAEVFKGHAEQLKPLVAELAEMESHIQKSYWGIKNRFTKK
jgi:hypothetical protein